MDVLKVILSFFSVLVVSYKNFFFTSIEPTQQSPPIVKQFNITSIAVKWSMPDYPNGIITHYIIRRNGSLIYTASESGKEA